MEQQFVVGGSVRDVLLGVPPKDIDFVWTGSSHASMVARKYNQVGSAFPVYLDEHGNEHALARTERKTGDGYYGFVCDVSNHVSISDDLHRRDLTINSLAVRVEDWEKFLVTRSLDCVIDPWGGVSDLQAGILRHTSAAFSEDSIRVLRTARFAARYGFKIADDTLALMTKVAPELEHVPQERIWAEFEKGLMEQFPSKMMVALAACEAFSTYAMMPYSGSLRVLDLDGDLDGVPLVSRFALIATEFTDDDYEVCKIPTHASRVSKAFNQHHQQLRQYHTLPPDARLAVLKSMRAIQDAGHLADVLEAATMWYGHQQMTASLLQINKDLKALRQVNLTHAPRWALAAGMMVKDYVQHLQLNALSE